jgi:flagellar biosynthesis protein FliQ|nr:flagellar biosynthetic protein FliQ [Novosphingobium panipatense]
MEDITPLLALADRMLWTTALVAAPVLIASLAVGLAVGVVQAATSVNEQTLTFVPKLAVTALVLVLFGSAMMALVGEFAQDVFTRIALIGQSGQAGQSGQVGP